MKATSEVANKISLKKAGNSWSATEVDPPVLSLSWFSIHRGKGGVGEGGHCRDASLLFCQRQEGEVYQVSGATHLAVVTALNSIRQGCRDRFYGVINSANKLELEKEQGKAGVLPVRSGEDGCRFG